MGLSILFPQQRTHQCTIKEIEDDTVSQIQKRLLQRTGEEIVDVIVPQTLEEIVEVIIVCPRVSPEEHVRTDRGRTRTTCHGGYHGSCRFVLTVTHPDEGSYFEEHVRADQGRTGKKHRRIDQSDFTDEGDRRLTWHADRNADLRGMKKPRLKRLKCGSLWSVTREIDCTKCVMADHMTVLNVQHWSARTMQVRNECPSTEL